MATNKMFRYLEKYIGIYRVMAPYDLETGNFPKDSSGGINKSFDDLYIPCKQGVIKHTYDEGILVWCCYDKPKTGHNVYEKIKTKYPDMQIRLDDFSDDILIYFNDSDIKKIATIVKPKTNGSKIKPYSARNLKTDATEKYKIPKEELNMISEITKSMDQGEKLLFSKNCISAFDKEIKKIKGKEYNLEKEREDSGLKNKEFIHSIGLWNEYITFVSKQYKKLKKENN